MRLIDAEKAIATIDEVGRTLIYSNYHDKAIRNDMVDFAIDMLKAMPTIDAEPVRHGRWEEVSMDTVCSVCGTKFNDEMYWIQGDGMNPNYCPECGAKMDKEEDENG